MRPSRNPASFITLPPLLELLPGQSTSGTVSVFRERNHARPSCLIREVEATGKARQEGRKGADPLHAPFLPEDPDRQERRRDRAGRGIHLYPFHLQEQLVCSLADRR